MKRGFTLVELLVVCLILCTLAGLTFAVCGSARRYCVRSARRAYSVPLVTLMQQEL